MSESADSSNIFNSQFNNEYKVLEDLSSFKSRRSETGMNDENNFFFLNFVHSSDCGGRDDVSVVQKDVSSDMCETHKLPYVAFCAVHEELVCEDCTDLTKNVDHNDKIYRCRLLLKML